MPEGVGYQNKQAVAGAGKTLQYAPPLVFAYSGNVDVSGSVTTMIEFTTGADENIKGRFQCFEDGGSDDDFELIISINDIAVVEFRYLVPYKINEQISILHFTIPPLSTVKLTLQRVSGSGSQTWNSMFNGEMV